MTGIHGLQQVKRFWATNLAHDDPFRTHPQTVFDQIAHRDLARAFNIWRAGFEANDVRLLKLQFRRVFTGDDALARLNKASQTVEQSRLTRARTARDQNVTAGMADNPQNFSARFRNRFEVYKVLKLQLVLFKLTNGECWPVNRQWRRDHVDTRTVQKTRVTNRAGIINAAANLAHDALTDIHQLGIVAEADIRALNLTVDFDIASVGAVHHDIGNVITREERLERAVAQHVITNIIEQVFLL